MNVATILPVSSPSLNRPQVSSIAFLAGPAPCGQRGAFSSLLDGLVSKSNDAGTGKKGEPKPKFALVQAIEVSLPAILKPPILFQALTWEIQSESIQGPHGPAPVDAAPEVQRENAVSFPAISEQARPISEENEPVSAAKIAFGLRLAIPHSDVSAATRSSSPEPQTGRVSDLNNLAPEGAEDERRSGRFPFARVTAGENRGESVSASALSDAHMPKQELSRLSLETESTLSNVTRASGSAGSGNGRAEDIPTAIGPGVGVGPPVPSHQIASSQSAEAVTPPDLGPRIPVGIEAPQGSKPPEGSKPPQGSKNDTKPVPDPSANVAPALILSRALADPQAANLQIADDQIPTEQAGKQKAVPGNAPLSTSPIRAASRVAAVVTEEAGIPTLQQQKAVKELGNATAAPNAGRPETSRENAVTGAPKAKPAQAAGVPDTTEGTSAADPRTTLSRTILSRATSSRAMSSQTISSETISSQAVTSQLPQAISSQDAAFQATGSEAAAAHATDVAIAPETNAPLQPPTTAKQISLKLSGDGAARVSVDFSEKGGKVQVAVRTADPELAKSLQTDLGDLVGRLESKGFKTEAWVPAASRHMPAAAPERSGSANSQNDPRHSSSGSDQRQGRPGQNGSNQRQQARWMAQLEHTLSTEETGTITE